MPTATNAELIAGLYTAFFNRAPETSGLNYWVDEFDAGADVRTLAAGFAGHPVFEATYGGMNSQQFVEAIYQNVLGAAGDADGINYWVGQLDNGGIPRHQMVADFVHSALTVDLEAMRASGQLSESEYNVAVQRQGVLTQKSEVGVLYAQQLGELTELSSSTDQLSKTSLEADPAYLTAQSIIAGVDAGQASKDKAGSLILSVAEALRGQDTSNIGLVGMVQSNQDAVDTSSYAGRSGQPDVYLFNTDNFDVGDTVRLTQFDESDRLFLDDQYVHRNKAPSLGVDTELEVFAEQAGSDVHLNVETDAVGAHGATAQLVTIVVVGATIDEIIPADAFT